MAAPADQHLDLADLVNNLNIGSDIEDLTSALVPSQDLPAANGQEVLQFLPQA